MKMTGEQLIAAPRERVWAALNDPDILQRSIPGCQSLEREADGRMRATVEVRIGPIGARFNGRLAISDALPPESYTITGEGQGGTVGSARGGARVRLAEDGASTLLHYDVDAEVGGRLAQLGGPIIDATAKQLAARFFRQFGEAVAGSSAGDTAPTVQAGAREEPAGRASPTASLIGCFLVALLGFLAGSAYGELDAALWIALSLALLVVVVAGIAFDIGRRAARRP